MREAPEAQFKRFVADYTGLSLQEITFGTSENMYGAEESYALDIMKAEDADPQAMLPVIVFVHGGGFCKPNDKRQAYIPLMAKQLVKMGFAVVSPDYPSYDSPEDRDRMTANESAACCIKPAEAVVKAVAYLNEHGKELGLDMDRLCMMGGSAGGMTCFYAVPQLSQTKCFVNLWGAPGELPDMASFPPVLSVHGTADKLVAYEREAVVTKALTDAGVENHLITLEDCGHTPLNKLDVFLPEVMRFIEKHCC